jgi:hypothetical protein
MAQRDKTQGFGFVYVDIEKLLAQRDELVKERALHPQAETAHVINLNRDQVGAKAKAVIADMAIPSTTSLEQIREKLDRLQTLHHKLHVVLEELTTVTGQDNKKKS